MSAVTDKYQRAADRARHFEHLYNAGKNELRQVKADLEALNAAYKKIGVPVTVTVEDALDQEVPELRIKVGDFPRPANAEDYRRTELSYNLGVTAEQTSLFGPQTAYSLESKPLYPGYDQKRYTVSARYLPNVIERILEEIEKAAGGLSKAQELAVAVALKARPATLVP